MVSQLAGGIAAALCATAAFGEFSNFGPAGKYSWIEAGIAETLYTCMPMVALISSRNVSRYVLLKFSKRISLVSGSLQEFMRNEHNYRNSWQNSMFSMKLCKSLNSISLTSIRNTTKSTKFINVLQCSLEARFENGIDKFDDT